MSRGAASTTRFEVDGEPPSPYDVPGRAAGSTRGARWRSDDLPRERPAAAAGRPRARERVPQGRRAGRPCPRAQTDPQRSDDEGLDVLRHGGRRRDRRLGPVPPGGGARYEVGCQLMLDEVNAAIEGAIAGGADRDRAQRLARHDGQPRPARSRRQRELHLRPAQAAVHDAGARRLLRRGLLRRLPRLDLRRPSTLSHTLQPRGVRRRSGQRRSGGGERHQRPGRRALRRARSPSSPATGRPGRRPRSSRPAPSTWSPRSRSPGSARRTCTPSGAAADPGGRRAGRSRGRRRRLRTPAISPPGHAGHLVPDRGHGRGRPRGPAASSARGSGRSRSPATTCWRCSRSFVAMSYLTRQVEGR